MRRVDLVVFGTAQIDWSMGHLWSIEPTPQALFGWMEQHRFNLDAEAWFFWHPRVGTPNEHAIDTALNSVGEVWHSGLRLGMSGLPTILETVQPGWMLDCDPDPTLDATSWRLCFDASLVRVDAVRQLGSIDPEFETLEGAALAWGWRFIKSGALMRYNPELIHIPPLASLPVRYLSLLDEARFLRYVTRPFWVSWGLVRSVMKRRATLWHAAAVWVRSQGVRSRMSLYQREPISASAPSDARVTVLIPTINRYPYLRVLLTQLEEQSIAPSEIIIIDQTPVELRGHMVWSDFAHLPIVLIAQDEAGQATSRNAGLQRSSGEYILFIDDDVEIPPNFIEQHLKLLISFNADTSSGVVYEPDVNTPDNVRRNVIRDSDVFPTNNTLARRRVLEKSGLFDLAYNHQPRADGDLGMRIYLSGHRMILDESHPILHHRAPQGGLRTHGARVITRDSSRTSLRQRHLPAPSEFYLMMRYFPSTQLTEMTLIRVLTTFRTTGSVVRRAIRLFVGLVLLPDTISQIRQRRAAAETMASHYPQIPTLQPKEINA